MAQKVFGIDMGTSTIKIYQKGHGIVLDEHNVIAIANRKNVIAIGEEAYEMYEKAPDSIAVTYPVRNGVIADVANMLTLLNHFMIKISKGKRLGPADYIVGVPTDITEVERRSFYEMIVNSNLKVGKIRLPHLVGKPGLGMKLIGCCNKSMCRWGNQTSCLENTINTGFGNK